MGCHTTIGTHKFTCPLFFPEFIHNKHLISESRYIHLTQPLFRISQIKSQDSQTHACLFMKQSIDMSPHYHTLIEVYQDLCKRDHMQKSEEFSGKIHVLGIKKSTGGGDEYTPQDHHSEGFQKSMVLNLLPADQEEEGSSFSVEI